MRMRARAGARAHAAVRVHVRVRVRAREVQRRREALEAQADERLIASIARTVIIARPVSRPVVDRKYHICSPNAIPE